MATPSYFNAIVPSPYAAGSPYVGDAPPVFTPTLNANDTRRVPRKGLRPNRNAANVIGASGAGAWLPGSPENLADPLSDVTSMVMQSGTLPAGAMPTGPTQNNQFSPNMPPTEAVPGQESAIPGTLFSRASAPSGRYIETLPGPESTTASGASASTLAGVLPPVNIPGVTSNAGTNAAIASLAGGGAGLTASLLGAGAAAGPIGMGVAGLVDLLSSLFHGANPLQVPAAETEQPYEAAADDVMSLAKSGQISTSQAQNYMQALEGAGQQAESSLVPQIGSPATAGSTNLTNVINQEIAALQKIGTPGAQPLNVQSSLSSFIQPGAAGWYPASGSDALTLLNALLGTNAQFGTA